VLKVKRISPVDKEDGALPPLLLLPDPPKRVSHRRRRVSPDSSTFELSEVEPSSTFMLLVVIPLQPIYPFLRKGLEVCARSGFLASPSPVSTRAPLRTESAPTSRLRQKGYFTRV